ncbi:MAG: ABC transporter ATP-binding protein [Bdellovibrionaceae bacterium]|nr:ABC transporter ATP-binding protein [Pseudobdellovibrionaceae bacterium]
MLISKELKKNYGKLVAVDGVSLEIQPGQCVGLLGPNGAGKSTFIGMVYGATPRSGGELSVFGLDPQTNSRDIKKRVGVVTQEDCLDEAMTVQENMSMFARFSGVPSHEIERRVRKLLEFMALDHKRDASIRALSGGMKRRLVFVRALLAQPELIILDEPTTGLDPAVRHLLWEKVLELKEAGTTILLTTHYMDEAERLCERLIIMDQGKIREDAPPRELIERHCPGYVAHFRNREVGNTLHHYLSEHPEGVVYEDSAGVGVRGPDLPWISAMVSKIETAPEVVRPANLEDVFLKITGRGLGSHA